MSRLQRPRARRLPLPEAGSILQVYAVSSSDPATAAPSAPPGSPRLHLVGAARVNPDQTITAWLEALPVSGKLVLRPAPHADQTSIRRARPQQALRGPRPGTVPVPC